MARMKTVSAFCLEAALVAIREALDDDRIRVEAIPFINGKQIELKVNWLSAGELSPDEASKFAAAICCAARIAKASPLNGAEVVYAS